MSYKSKKSKQTDKTEIKKGITGIIALGIILIFVLIINTATLNANLTIQDIYMPAYARDCFLVEANTHLSRINCEVDGIQRCKIFNPDTNVPLNQANICYKKCEWHIKEMCRNAPETYKPYI
jgi:hypothetical protein